MERRDDFLDKVLRILLRYAGTVGILAATGVVGSGHFLQEGWGSPYSFPWLAVLLVLLLVATYNYLKPTKQYPWHDLEFLAVLVVSLGFFIQVTGGLDSPLRAGYYLLVALTALFYPVWLTMGAAASALVLEASATGIVDGGLSVSQWITLGTTGFFLFLIAGILGWILEAEKRQKDLAVETLNRLQTDAESLDPLAGEQAELTLQAHLQDEAFAGLARSVLEMDRLLENLLFTVKEAIPCYTVGFFSRDSEENTLVLRSHMSCEDAVAKHAVIPMGGGYVGWVGKEGTPLNLGRLQEGAAGLLYYDREVSLASFLAVPVMVEEVLEGVLVVDSQEAQAFSQDDQALLARFANHIGDLQRKAREAQQVLHQATSYRALHRISTVLSTTIHPSEIMERLTEHVGDLAPHDACCLLLLEGPEAVVHTVRGVEGISPGARFPVKNSILHLLAESPQGLILSDLDSWSGRPGLIPLDPLLAKARAFLGVPLRVGGEVLGFLSLTAREAGFFTSTHLHLLHTLCNQAAALLQNARLHQEVERMAVTDSMTGLPNRRSFHHRLEGEAERLKRHPAPLAILMVDIDHFKRINDRHGHPVGDAVLQVVAEVLQESMRTVDLVARYGGEEFAAVLVETDEPGALQTAERIRVAVAERDCLVDGERVPVAVSIGVAAWNGQGAFQGEDLLAEADRALYQAKELGRNRVAGSRTLRSASAGSGQALVKGP